MGRARVARRSRLPDGTWIWDNKRPYKSKDCVYVVLYRLGGRGSPERSLGTWTTRAAAEERCAWAEREIAAGRDPRTTLANPIRHETFEAAAKRLRPQRLAAAPKSIRNYDQAVSHLGKLAKIPVGSLTPADFVAWLGSVKGANSTKLRYLYQYRKILKLCGVDPNPAKHDSIEIGSTAPAGRAKEGWVPSYANLQRLLAVLNPQHAAVVRLLEGTGLRSVEADNLLRSHIDLSTNTIHVFETKGETVIPRSIPITTEVRKLLVDDFGIKKMKPTDHVLPVRCGAVGMSTGRYSKKLGFPQTVTPHSLRRRFTSRLGNASIPIPDTSLMVGHRKSSTTLDVYSFPLTDEPAARRRALRRDVMRWLGERNAVADTD